MSDVAAGRNALYVADYLFAGSESLIAMMDRRPAAPEDSVDITVAIVNYNTADLLPNLFASIEAARGTLRLELIVVDNASRDNSVELLRDHYGHVELIRNVSNVGFGRANNQVLSRARGRYLLLLNTDAFMEADTLAKTFDFMEGHANCGVLGVRLIGRDGSAQPSCRYFPTPWNTFLSNIGLQQFFPRTRLVDDVSWHPQRVTQCDWVPGCFYLIRREVIEQVGLFDPRYFLYFEEVDHCQAVKRAGWIVNCYPFTTVTHFGGESALTDGPISTSSRQIQALQVESQLLYFRKHHGVSGVLVSAILTLAADLLRACRSLWGGTPKGSPMGAHTIEVIKLIIATRFASRPTR